MQFNHRFQEVAAKVQAAEAVVQATEARRAETLEAHISQTRKAIRAHNISISYNFLWSTTFVKEHWPSGRPKASVRTGSGRVAKAAKIWLTVETRLDAPPRARIHFLINFKIFLSQKDFFWVVES